MDYALRMMRKDLPFTIIIVAVLALAIGAGTVAFSAANAILIQPLPFADGNRLVELKQLQPAVRVDNLPFSVQEIHDYRTENHTLDSVVEYHEMTFSLLGGREPERVDTAVVSANFFRVLGVTPLYGRGFLDEDDRPSAHPVLILSYQFWQRSFGGDPNVVGQTYSMNDKQHVVVGVLPAMPQFPEKVDVYMPTSACPTRSSEHLRTDRTARLMSAFGTVKPGVSLAQAEADLRGIAERLRSKYPGAYPAAKGYDIAIVPVHEQLSRDIRPVLIALATAAALLLLLACSNVAGLMLSRILGRSRELTVRAALGASRTRIVRSFVTEGILLAILGGVGGLLLAFWSLDIVVRFTAKFTSLSSELRISPQVIAFCFLISIACGVVIGLLPAIGSAANPLIHDATRWCGHFRPGRFPSQRNSGGCTAGVLRRFIGGGGPHPADPGAPGTYGWRFRLRWSCDRAYLRTEFELRYFLRSLARTDATSVGRPIRSVLQHLSFVFPRHQMECSI